LQAGASEIIQPELEASATMIRHALDYLKLPADQSTAYLERFREAVGAAQVVSSVAGTPLPDVYEFEVDGPPLVDQSLRQARIRERFGVTVVAVRKRSGELVVNPPGDTVVNTGDKIRVFGQREQIENFIPSEKSKADSYIRMTRTTIESRNVISAEVRVSPPSA
jgi:Trk K+ transport system NAD-binding subunit